MPDKELSLEEKNLQLEKENENLRDLLEEKYPNERLLIYSVTSLFFFIWCVFGYYWGNLTLVHPVLCVPCLVASLGFTLLSFATYHGRTKMKPTES